MSEVRFTRKQRAFIDEYVVDFNATQAALRAGYSEKTAYSIGHENLKKPEIVNEIQRLIESRAMSRDEALYRVGAIARFDIAPYVIVDEVGRVLIDVEKLKQDGHGHLIRGVSQTRYGSNVELANPDSALKIIIDETHPRGTADDPQHVVVSYITENRGAHDSRD